MRCHVLVLVVGLISQTPSRTPPTEIFTALGLTSEQSASIESGRPVAKVLPWGGPSEVYVFGAVHVDGAPETYLKAARDVSRLRGTPGYLGVGELRADATVSDLTPLTLDADDVKALKNCREGSCDVQLPTASIQAVRDTVNFSRPDAAEQVNALARQMIVALLRTYRQGGLRALGEYRDKEHPARVSDEFETTMSRASVLPDVIPELRRYLLKGSSCERSFSTTPRRSLEHALASIKRTLERSSTSQLTGLAGDVARVSRPGDNSPADCVDKRRLACGSAPACPSRAGRTKVLSKIS